MRIVSIVGFKKSGKTTLTGLVADALERKGQRVGIIKHSHHALDKQNTDTFWLMRPGRVVAGCCPDEAAVFWSQPVAAQNLASLMDVDVVLVEGGKTSGIWPRILCLKEAGEAPLLAAPGGEILGCKPLPSAMAGETADSGHLALATVGAAPQVPYGPHYAELSPETAEALAEHILRHGAILGDGANHQKPAVLVSYQAPSSALVRHSDSLCSAPHQVVSSEKGSCGMSAPAQPAVVGCVCSDPAGPQGKGPLCPCEKMRPTGGVSVSVGGASLEMHAFVEKIVAGTITGMLRELKGYDADKEIVIRLSPRF